MAIELWLTVTETFSCAIKRSIGKRLFTTRKTKKSSAFASDGLRKQSGEICISNSG
jgi:hypothetical protein